MESIFTDKYKEPTADDLKAALGHTYPLWKSIQEQVVSEYPKAVEEWLCSKAGWHFRMKDKKRAIIYLLPRDKFFKVAFVFGQKATDAILQSNIGDFIKTELKSARVYAEGRGIRIDIKDEKLISDIKLLISIKLAH
jgi:hypothetical protein